MVLWEELYGNKMTELFHSERLVFHKRLKFYNIAARHSISIFIKRKC